MELKIIQMLQQFIIIWEDYINNYQIMIKPEPI